MRFIDLLSLLICHLLILHPLLFACFVQSSILLYVQRLLFHNFWSLVRSLARFHLLLYPLEKHSPQFSFYTYRFYSVLRIALGNGFHLVQTYLMIKFSEVHSYGWPCTWTTVAWYNMAVQCSKKTKLNGVPKINPWEIKRERKCSEWNVVIDKTLRQGWGEQLCFGFRKYVLLSWKKMTLL